MSSVLVVAATERELCGLQGSRAGSGRSRRLPRPGGRLRSKHRLPCCTSALRARRGVPPGQLVIGGESVYCDLRAAIPLVTTLRPDPVLLAAAQRALPGARTAPIETRAAVTGPRDPMPQGVRVEAMEGFGVLRAAQLAGVPALELRAISNELGEADRARWRIDEALAALASAIAAAPRRDRRERVALTQGAVIRTCTSSCSIALPRYTPRVGGTSA